ncbi:MAG: polysaccharide deacetylase family protein [Melioribacteraceae bacterium]|nr:polysaccharide deacetylase family protein [Melioribacteraceae bacterium]MCF8355418.1 polysaccharide deacetylase family protein [Melioribacteraceae bacterium]MCF8393260.1 polysaccharide deacetylase family protein [Melioribacteraceae bacterium]MCF8417561.1 polysaccharide deacetylase family protein [Melioribacteraceae bacterium]
MKQTNVIILIERLMKNYKSILLLILLSTFTFAQNQKYIAVTFDDLPFQHSRAYSSEELVGFSRQLINNINMSSIQAVGFVNEDKLYNEEEIDTLKLSILKMWLDAGLELGNHTFSHMNINSVDFEDYKNDIIKGAKITKALAEERNMKYEYFRHPYLRSGETETVMLALKEFLKENNYKTAPVTIDNSEWIFAGAFNKAFKSNDTELMAKLGSDYVEYMIRKIEYYEDQSQKLFGRNIKHVLLVHANLLNAKYFDNLAAAVKNKGYEFISLDEALTDEAYQSENNFVGRYGPSWIHRWALTKGVDKSFFEGEPTTPKYVMEYAGIDYE